MSATILRLGLWTLVLVLALYVIHETYEGQTLADMIPMNMVQHTLVVAVGLVIAGMVLRMVEKTRSTVSKNRCRVCQTVVPPGAIYCRPHLRGMLEREDRKTHSTRIH
jgi:predicted nucleic acid-binding Zn ribbon protein